MTRVSVIIPTYNGEGFLRRLLPVLLAQEPHPPRIIVIDSSSCDGSASLARELGCEVEVIPQREFNHGGTRNRGVALARDSDVLVFLTQDALPEGNDFLRRLVEPISSGRAWAAYARQVPYPEAYPPEVFARGFNYPSESHIRCLADVPKLGLRAFFFSNVASAISYGAFTTVGGFPADVIMNEDMVLCSKILSAGGTVAYAADARVRHSHNYSVLQQFRRYFDIGTFLADRRKMVAGPSGRHGLRFAVGQVAWCARHGALGWVPRCCVETAAKYLAVSLGKRHHRLSKRIKRRLSMHAFHWR